jgi:hypothetical protein
MLKRAVHIITTVSAWQVDQKISFHTVEQLCRDSGTLNSSPTIGYKTEPLNRLPLLESQLSDRRSMDVMESVSIYRHRNTQIDRLDQLNESEIE